MCGIGGAVNLSKDDFKLTDYKNMEQVLKRRGPDQNGVFQSENVILVHTRLSVVDLENGIQPMTITYEGESYTIVYNGELYNTEDIRSVLISKGHTFKGHSDTEVVLHCYAEFKEKCLELFNGIFAFSVWEKHSRKLFVARDRIGVKPFFYGLKNDTFYFGSEIKTLLSHKDFRPTINIQSIAELFLLGPGKSQGNAIFTEINELPPAHFGYFTDGHFETQRYWRLKENPQQLSFNETVCKVKDLVTDAIERQLVSDVPICTFLSGGLDSSIISAVAARHLKKMGEKLTTFSVSYSDNDKYFKKSFFQPDSDDKYIKIMSNHIESNHYNIVVDTPQLVGALFDAVDARDLPGMVDIDSSLLLFCKEVKKHTTVALSGECADEIFGGYPWYRVDEIRNRIGFPWSQSIDYRQSFINRDISDLIDAKEYVMSRYYNTINSVDKSSNLSPIDRRIREMTVLNFDWFMQTLLDRKDRMSMYNGLEVRVPFCDHNIVEFLYSVPWEFKNYKGREKGLLRYAMSDILPRKIAWRKKSPYPKTHNPSYLSAVSKILSDIISSPSSPILKIADKSQIEKLLKNPLSAEPWYGQLMTGPQTIAYFIQMDYWMKKYDIDVIE